MPFPIDCGRNLTGTLDLMQEENGLILDAREMKDIVDRENECVIRAIEWDLFACSGVRDVLNRLAATQTHQLAIVSSSDYSRLHASLCKTKLDKYFSLDRVFSAVSSLATPTSKPSPDIYLHACSTMDILPCESLAIEDSVTGVLSAVNAGIHVLGYVGCLEGAKAGEMRCALSSAGAIHVMGNWKEFWEALGHINGFLTLGAK